MKFISLVYILGYVTIAKSFRFLSNLKRFHSIRNFQFDSIDTRYTSNSDNVVPYIERKLDLPDNIGEDRKYDQSEFLFNLKKYQDEITSNNNELKTSYINFNTINSGNLLQSPPLPPLKVMVFIDGTWLYYSMQVGRGEHDIICTKFGLNWIATHKIDWVKIPQIILDNLMDQLRKQYGYTRYIDIVRNVVFTSAKENTPDDSLRFNMINTFSQNNFEVNCLTTLNDQEKCVDISLAVEMLYLALIPHTYDIAVLVTGDKDFIPAMQKTRIAGKRVVLCSKKNSCNRDFLPTGNHRDLDIIWLDYYLDTLVIPKQTSNASSYFNSINLSNEPVVSRSNVFPFNKIENKTENLVIDDEDRRLLRHICKFISNQVDDDGEELVKVNSRQIGRFLNNLVYDDQITALSDLKTRHTTLLSFFVIYNQLFNVEIDEPNFPQYTVELTSNYKDFLAEDIHTTTTYNYDFEDINIDFSEIDMINIVDNIHIDNIMNDSNIDQKIKDIIQYLYKILLKYNKIGSRNLKRLLINIDGTDKIGLIITKYGSVKSFFLKYPNIFKVLIDNQDKSKNSFDLTLADNSIDIITQSDPNFNESFESLSQFEVAEDLNLEFPEVPDSLEIMPEIDNQEPISQFEGSKDLNKSLAHLEESEDANLEYPEVIESLELIHNIDNQEPLSQFKGPEDLHLEYLNGNKSLKLTDEIDKQEQILQFEEDDGLNLEYSKVDESLELIPKIINQDTSMIQNEIIITNNETNDKINDKSKVITHLNDRQEIQKLNKSIDLKSNELRKVDKSIDFAIQLIESNKINQSESIEYFNKLTIKQLKELAKLRNITTYCDRNKTSLIELIINKSLISIRIPNNDLDWQLYQTVEDLIILFELGIDNKYDPALKWTSNLRKGKINFQNYFNHIKLYIYIHYNYNNLTKYTKLYKNLWRKCIKAIPGESYLETANKLYLNKKLIDIFQINKNNNNNTRYFLDSTLYKTVEDIVKLFEIGNEYGQAFHWPTHIKKRWRFYLNHLKLYIYIQNNYKNLTKTTKLIKNKWKDSIKPINGESYVDTAVRLYCYRKLTNVYQINDDNDDNNDDDDDDDDDDTIKYYN